MKRIKKIIAVFTFFITSSALAIIDTKNANYSQTSIDMEVPGSGYDLKVIRTYNSRSLHDGMFGFGWCSNYETALDISDKKSIKVIECGSGQETLFNLAQGTPLAQGSRYQSVNNRTDEIIVNKDYFQRQLPDGGSLRFTRDGKLALMYDKNGNFLKYEYQGSTLRTLVDNNGRRLNFTYYPNKKIKTIVGPNGLRADYQYKGLVDLSVVKNGWGNTYKYEYDDLHNLTKVTYPDNTFVLLTYDQKKDWVLSFQDREKCLEKYTYELSKTQPNDHYWANITKTCEGRVVNQSKHEFWFKNKKNGPSYLSRVMTIVNGFTVDIVYHEEFLKPVSIRRNNVTSEFQYSSKGQVTKKINPDSIISYQYDKTNNKVSRVQVEYLDEKKKVRSKRVTDYKYDNKLNLIQAKDSDGQIVDMAYDEKGRISQVRDQSKKLVKVLYEEKFGKPRELQRPGVGKVRITYKPSGDIDKVQSPEGPTIALQVASTFNSMLDMIGPATAEIYN